MMGIAAKILNVMKTVDKLSKDGNVSYGSTNYDYLSEEKITSEVRKAMIEEGLIIFPTKMEYLGEREVETKKGLSFIDKIQATYIIEDSETGEQRQLQTIGSGMDSGDKSFYKAMTGAFKYAQRESFMISTGDDPDKISSEELVGDVKTDKNKEFVFTGGKHKGKSMSQVYKESQQYITWLASDNGRPEEAKKAAREFLAKQNAAK